MIYCEIKRGNKKKLVFCYSSTTLKAVYTRHSHRRCQLPMHLYAHFQFKHDTAAAAAKGPCCMQMYGRLCRRRRGVVCKQRNSYRFEVSSRFFSNPLRASSVSTNFRLSFSIIALFLFCENRVREPVFMRYKTTRFLKCLLDPKYLLPTEKYLGHNVCPFPAFSNSTEDHKISQNKTLQFNKRVYLYFIPSQNMVKP